MRSNDNRGPSGSLDTSDQAAPGWLFVLPWSLRNIGGVNEVVKSLIVQLRDGGVFCPHLLVSSENSELGGTVEPELIKPHYLEIWSPVDRKRPIRGLLSFLYRLPYRCWALRRIIDQHNEDFAAHVHAFEIIPLKFGRLNAVPGKDQVGIDCAGIHHALGPSHKIVLKFRREGTPVAGNTELHLRVRRNSDQAHILQEGAIGIAGLEARAAELVLQILNRELFAFGSRTASFECVGGKRANVCQHAIAGNRFQGRIGRTRPARASTSTMDKFAAEAPVTIFRVYWTWPGVSAMMNLRRGVAK